MAMMKHLLAQGLELAPVLGACDLCRDTGRIWTWDYDADGGRDGGQYEPCPNGCAWTVPTEATR